MSRFGWRMPAPGGAALPAGAEIVALVAAALVAAGHLFDTVSAVISSGRCNRAAANVVRDRMLQRTIHFDGQQHEAPRR
jgi:hypothetical protein